MSDLIDTTEMYLRTVFELQEEGIVPLRARIADRLGHSGPTVSQTVARMERDGLLRVTGDRHLEMTVEGYRKATRVMRKHRLAERLLLDVIGLEWELVHDEACRWEHVISERVEGRLLAMLKDPLESPYGNPIPGLEELGGPHQDITVFRQGLVTLPEALCAVRAPGAESCRGRQDEGLSLRLRRIGEPAQTDIAFLRELSAARSCPGDRIVACRSEDTFRVRGDRNEVTVSREVADHLFVEALVPR
ncbi:MAG: DtxR family transcriptional regulator, Mn-dependent transcriptional regulator [Actinomycetota bacterium]|nr:DtxR family transcriptional regulator, Mn-dependent transcriptional regulator [Actinomycetota bacterium]